MSLSASWKRSLSFFCGLLVRRAADVRFFARFAMISPVGPLENACPVDQCCVTSKVPTWFGQQIAAATLLKRSLCIQRPVALAWVSDDSLRLRRAGTNN